MSRMMWSVVVLLGAGISLWAADFWEKKKFAEWTDKETRQMMTDSPWARRVDVPLGSGMAGSGGRGGRGGGGRGARAGGGGLGAESGGFGNEGGGIATGAEAAGAPRIGGADMGAEGGVVQTLPLIVRWQSSLPVKQALVRTRWGAEAATSQEAAKLLGRQEQYYIVLVGGVPGRMIQGAGQSLKQSSFLKIGKSDPIPALDVQINAGQVAEIYLLFPRLQPGAHVITLEDKDVEVASRIGPLDVRRKFRLKDMVFDGKLEL
ncbi:MAG: hypothetical protein HY238_01675 [Acidobacteria bacterium]|nr:hypothetical protein [Acidobacteriota bacterium]